MKKVSIILLIGMICLLSNSVFSAAGGAGGGGIPIPVAGGVPSESLFGNISLPGLHVNYNSYNSDDTSWASVNFTLENSIFGNASWSFYTYPDDPSIWNASMYLSGWYLGEDGVAPDSFGKNQNSSINFSDVYLTSYLDIDYFQDTSLRGYGRYSISPAIITSTNFFYNEYEDPWRNLTRWNVDYYIVGHFIADTLEGAQAMGAPFIIPEPATMILLGLGAISLMRRRRR